MSTAEVYALVKYDNLPLPQTHPSHLYALGKLAGLQPAAVETCRVLELGSNQGSNLVPMAHHFPKAEFVGVDLAVESVERGRACARELGLRNLRLEAMDLLAIDKSYGPFDYIIAHGVYGWTPEIVTDKVLEIMGALLSPHGMGFVSYNLQPVGYIRKMVREMLLFHARDAANPVEKLAKTREMLSALTRPRDVDRMDAYDAVLVAHARDLLLSTDSTLMHDDLSASYEPIAFTAFVAHARSHGLQYVNDAGKLDPQGAAGPRGMDEEGVRISRAMAGGERIVELQYQDYLRMRRFRQSVLCRAELPVALEWRPGAALGLHASTRAAEVSPNVFEVEGEFQMSISHPSPVTYLRRLIALAPASEAVSAMDADLAAALFNAGVIQLHGAASLAVRARERPCAGELIRFQARRGDKAVSNLRHEPLEVDDGMRRLLVLLDGTRDCETLAEAAGCTVEEMRRELDDFAAHGLLIESRAAASLNKLS